MKANNNQVTFKQMESIGKLSQYIIMPRFGQNLSEYFNSQNFTMSRVSIIDLGMQLLRIIE
jgi:hypothetical protein